MDHQKVEFMIELLIIIICSVIAGAACVGIQLEKVKRQRDEARKQLQQAYDSGFDQGYMLGKKIGETR
ncbi:hypothetical protein [Lactococcus garvieae]|uniref:hypothetical protein n=1 Tax=Lactococcus garvieae TaxID=1363 RepID=UPI001897CC3D|nr:hypothetical protein [Lactococcus garvieae]MDB7634360.1 hypothetical protein [Lactococcus garvieae]